MKPGSFRGRYSLSSGEEDRCCIGIGAIEKTTRLASASLRDLIVRNTAINLRTPFEKEGSTGFSDLVPFTVRMAYVDVIW